MLYSQFCQTNIASPATRARIRQDFRDILEESSLEKLKEGEIRAQPFDPIFEISALQQVSQQLPLNPTEAASKRSTKHEASSYTRSSTSVLSSDISGYTYPNSPLGSNRHWKKGWHSLKANRPQLSGQADSGHPHILTASNEPFGDRDE